MKTLFYILFSFLCVPLYGQYRLWFYDGNICKVDTFSIDSAEHCIVYKSGKRISYAYFDELYAITGQSDTTVFYDSVDVNKAFAFIQGIHDGLHKFNCKVFIIGALVAVSSHLVLSNYNVAIRAIPVIVYSFTRGFYKSVDLDTIAESEVYAAGVKIGQARRGVADAVIGSVVGSYVGMGVIYLIIGL